MINLLCFIENFPLRWKLAGWLLLPEQVRVKLNSNRAAQWFASLAKAGKRLRVSENRSFPFVFTRFGLRVWVRPKFRSVSKTFSAQASLFFERNTCSAFAEKEIQGENGSQIKTTFCALFFISVYPPTWAVVGQKCGWKERKKYNRSYNNSQATHKSHWPRMCKPKLNPTSEPANAVPSFGLRCGFRPP